MHLTYFLKPSAAFARVELLTVLATAGLLGTLGLSVLANTGVRNESAVCANNLRQVGRAFHIWANDHGGENPWWVSYNDGGCYIRPGGPTPPGNVFHVPGAGTVPTALRNNAWLHFGYISQELQTPALLVCPTDRTKQRAQKFTNTPPDGFFSVNFRNRAMSYLVGLHAGHQQPLSLLSGDRSLKEDAVDSSCSANVGAASSVFPDGSPPGWTSDLHPNSGNLLFNDGHVDELSAAGLARTYLGSNADENGSTHFLKPH